MESEQYSLRELKHAKTKISIVNAFISALEKSKFDDISIRSICKTVEISEGTFFNYFPEKIDIVTFYVDAIFIKAVWKARRGNACLKGLSFIDVVFENLAFEVEDLNIVYQIISVLISQKDLAKDGIVSALERYLLFPGCEGIEDVRLVDIETFFKESLKDALENGELPRSINLDDLVVSLITILSGTLLATKFFGGNKKRAYHFKRQLQILWSGLGIKNR